MYLNSVRALDLAKEPWDFLFFLNHSSFMNKQAAPIALANLSLSCFVRWKKASLAQTHKGNETNSRNLADVVAQN